MAGPGGPEGPEGPGGSEGPELIPHLFRTEYSKIVAVLSKR